MNTPNRSDHYLMSIETTIRRILAKNPSSILPIPVRFVREGRKVEENRDSTVSTPPTPIPSQNISSSISSQEMERRKASSRVSLASHIGMLGRKIRVFASQEEFDKFKAAGG